LASTTHAAASINPWPRALVAGTGLAIIALGAHALFGSPLTLGAGYNNPDWAFDPRPAVIAVVALLVFRAAAPVLTVGGGGVGGLFIPLVIEGALAGRAIGGLFRASWTASHFFPRSGSRRSWGPGTGCR